MNAITTKTNEKPYTRLPDAHAGFKRRPDGDLLDAHRQMASRPADEAVYTTSEYLERASAMRARSKVFDVNLKDLKVSVTDDGLPAIGRGGAPLALTPYSLQALCRDLGGEFNGKPVTPPTGYLASLPGEKMADLLTFEIGRAKDREIQILAAGTPKGPIVRGITSQGYERYWDAEQAEKVHALCSRSSWGAATAFQRAGGVKPSHAWGDVAPLPLGWIGDRSSFIVLVDHETTVNLNGNQLQRFVMLGNSEVGAASADGVFGLMDFACGNFILWGCQEVYEFAFAHRGRTFRERISKAFSALSHLPALDSGKLERDAYKASKYLLGDTREQVVAKAKAKTGLPAITINEGYERASLTERYGDPRSVWGLVNGLTEASQHRAGFADDRTDIDAKAAKLFDFVF